MREIKKLSMAIIIVLFAGMNMQTYAQMEFEAGQRALNLGLSRGFDFEEFGIRAGVTQFLNPAMRLGGDITFWLVDAPKDVTIIPLEIYANFNYIFYNDNDFLIYGIGTAGFQYIRMSGKDYYGDSHSDSDSDFGIGVGVGFEYNTGSFGIFGEPKFIIAGFPGWDQTKLNLGIRLYR